MCFTGEQVLERGLRILKFDCNEQIARGNEFCRTMFRAACASPPEAVAQLWRDLVDTHIAEARLTESEKSHNGLKMLLLAHCELWTCPRSAALVQAHFAPVAVNETRGEPLWKWIRKTHALLPAKTFWPDSLNDPEEPGFVATVDGVDCRIWEKRDHPNFPLDEKLCSHKFNHAALKCEIAVAVCEDKIVWVNGPWMGSKHDLAVLREGQADGSGSLLDLIVEGKMIVADRGHRTSNRAELKKIAFKRNDDQPALKKFKARATCRHETVNARLKQFRCLSDTFRHGEDKQEAAFKAVCVIVQCHLDMDVGILCEV